jgi:hypothetical protein
MPGSNSETLGRFCDGLGSNIMVFVTLHDQITAREYVDTLGNHVHPMIQTLFPNNYAVFQGDIVPIHTAGAIQSWFEEREGERHLPWPPQSPDLSVIEPLWLVLETRVRNRFPLLTSLKQLEVVLQDEWYKIPLETVQNLYESIPRSIAAVLKAQRGPTLY